MRRCSIEGCSGKRDARGWCSRHYGRWRRYGDPEHPDQRPKPKKCGLEGCEHPHEAKGFCSTHYERFRRHGKPFADVPIGELQHTYKDTICLEAGCEGQADSRGRCRNCYQRMARQHRSLMLVASCGGACYRCGESYPPVVFDFHHRDPSEKEAPVSRLVDRWNWDRLIEEVRKCDMLCANCHRIVTWGEGAA